MVDCCYPPPPLCNEHLVQTTGAVVSPCFGNMQFGRFHSFVGHTSGDWCGLASFAGGMTLS